jgi:D-glycero-D-manno-heptose 1,7-bisphosphate phosphatase
VLPGVPEALDLLRSHGLALVVVTNQPDVARGTQTRATVEAINARLRAALPPLDDLLVCFHDTPDGCGCRKPKPGMLTEAAATHALDLRRSFMVGDRWSDIVAGQAAGCTTLLLDMPYSGSDRCAPDYTAVDLAAAARQIVRLLG